MVKEIDMQIQEAQRVPIMMDAKRPSLRHFVIKRPKGKNKERLLKTAREKKEQEIGNPFEKINERNLP